MKITDAEIARMRLLSDDDLRAFIEEVHLDGWPEARETLHLLDAPLPRMLIDSLRATYKPPPLRLVKKDK